MTALSVAHDAEISAIAAGFDALNDAAQDALAENIADLRASTVGGMAAKARIIRAMLGDDGLNQMDGSVFTESRLLASLLRDLLSA